MDKLTATPPKEAPGWEGFHRTEAIDEGLIQSRLGFRVSWGSEILAARRAVQVAGESVRSLEAGLISLLLLTGTLATFGVWFNLPLAYVLTTASVVAALLSLHWAHQAAHAFRQDPKLVGKAHSWLGTSLALVALFGSTYANGLLLLMVHPLAWGFWLAIGTVLVAIHFERERREQVFLDTFDFQTGTSTCARCGARIPLEDGRWTRPGWVCATCSSFGGA